MARLLLERRYGDQCSGGNKDDTKEMDSHSNKDEMRLGETEILDLIDKLPPVEKLCTVLKGISQRVLL